MNCRNLFFPQTNSPFSTLMSTISPSCMKVPYPARRSLLVGVSNPRSHPLQQFSMCHPAMAIAPFGTRLGNASILLCTNIESSHARASIKYPSVATGCEYLPCACHQLWLRSIFAYTNRSCPGWHIEPLNQKLLSKAASFLLPNRVPHSNRLLVHGAMRRSTFTSAIADRKSSTLH